MGTKQKKGGEKQRIRRKDETHNTATRIGGGSDDLGQRDGLRAAHVREWRLFQRVQIARETSTTFSNAVAFNNVPGASVPVSVPAGSSRLIMARFSAESSCSGGAGAQYCSIRIVAVNVASGAVTELSPQSGIDFAFDSTDSASETFASWEGHSMDRSERLGAGDYRIQVQRAVTNAAVTLRLDDYSLTVEQAT